MALSRLPHLSGAPLIGAGALLAGFWAGFLAAPPALAQTSAATPPALPSASAYDRETWLTRLLDALKPGVDTSLPETSREQVNRLSAQLDRGQAAATLAEIDKRLDADLVKSPDTVNAQLLFLKARALNLLGRRDEAKAVYTDMTQRFPELPEPWNNLASIYVAEGLLDQAKDALDMAVRTDPGYAIARENLGDVYMMLAARAYADAARLAPHDPAAARKQAAALDTLKGRPQQP